MCTNPKKIERGYENAQYSMERRGRREGRRRGRREGRRRGRGGGGGGEGEEEEEEREEDSSYLFHQQTSLSRTMIDSNLFQPLGTCELHLQ